jgi:glyoxylase-like metal-dependent hydrolase (beta-lactamase superfamily II)
MVKQPLLTRYVKLNRIWTDGKRWCKIYFETHFHADFVSGHVDLSRETGAQLFMVKCDL